MKTPVPRCSGPLASLVEIQETAENTERDPNAPEPAAEGDIQMEYTSDQMCIPNNEAVTNITCKKICAAQVV